jgi:hypothetical protein
VRDLPTLNPARCDYWGIGVNVSVFLFLFVVLLIFFLSFSIELYKLYRFVKSKGRKENKEKQIKN